MINNFQKKNYNQIKTIKLTKGDIYAVFIRSNFFQGSWNFERMQALGFCFSIIPVIRRLYTKNSKEQKAAIKRHLEFFNTHPYAVAPILGVIMAMEEKKANNINNVITNNNNDDETKIITVNDASINGLKIGLMGPLAGIGDPVFWGTARPVLSALGSGIAMSGNILGPCLFYILFNAIRLITRYYGIIYGYNKGTNIVNDMGGGFLKKLTEGSAILGLFVMGALVNKWTHINIPCVLSKITDNAGNVVVTTVQNILDQLMPGCIPLLLTLFCMWLLNKKINALWIIIGFFNIGIFGYWTGLLGL